MHKVRRSRAKSVAANKTGKAVEVDQADVNGAGNTRASFVPRTDLGRRLWKIRQRIVNSGQPLLDWEGIANELRERTGEATERPSS
jgi:hypothetical protein